MSKHWAVFPLIVLYLIGAIVVAWQPMRAVMSPEFRGMLPYNGSEEAMYMLRTQEALQHPFSDATNGVWSGADRVSGPQTAGLEEAIGSLFFWTGIPAPWLVLFLSILIAPLVIPLTFALARRCGATQFEAIVAGVFFFWLISFARRYFHPAFSMPFTLGTLLLLWRWHEVPTKARAIVAGIFLGLSVGIYLWAWTLLWTVAIVLVILQRAIKPRIKLRFETTPHLFGIGLLIAVPTLLRMLMARMDPNFAATAMRVGLAQSHLPESWMRSILTVLIAILAYFLIKNSDDRKKPTPLLALFIALAVVFNQQILHGTVMSFSSHYANPLFLACVLLLCLVHRTWQKSRTYMILTLSAIVLLIGAVHDYNGRLAAFAAPGPGSMKYQHLASALQTIGTEPFQTILTDETTADLVASYTRHDVVFTEYSAFLLTTDAEFAERACLSTLATGKLYDFESHVVFEEARLRIRRNQESVTEYLNALTDAKETCDKVLHNGSAYLMKYGVTLLLWDEKDHPEWKIDKILFTKIKQGEGWSIWEPK